MSGLPNMALQRTRRPRLRSGRSLCSLGSPLNAQPLGVGKVRSAIRCDQRSPRVGRPFVSASVAREWLKYHLGGSNRFERRIGTG
jgi:hypothetical protein